MTDHQVPLTTLYARFDAYAEGHAFGRGCWVAHEAVLDRLAENQRVAEGYGWTSCALERAGGTGPLQAWGVPPAEGQRHPIPDWPSTPQA